MDFSASMSAEDEKPNRLTLARFKLLDILNARKDAQNALVVFAGDAFTVSPLTDDIDTIQEQVKNLTPDIMPAPGSLLTPAIQRSVELLQQAGMKKGSILLMTDGVSDPEAAIGVAEEAHDRGMCRYWRLVRQTVRRSAWRAVSCSTVSARPWLPRSIWRISNGLPRRVAGCLCRRRWAKPIWQQVRMAGIH